MNITVTGQNIEITDALRNHLDEKFEKLQKHFDHIISVHAILKVEKLSQEAEATVHVPGSEIFANSEAEDMYAAIDQLSHKLLRQIDKHKEKLRN